ncbi:MAG: DMT family transporter, partial [Chlorobiales bacterium]|nr:DMT family transporter [Chlorobiales bacterium]
MHRFACYLPVLGLLLAMMLWASSFVALKIAFRAYDPMVVIFGRMLVASLCFLFFYRWFRAGCDFRRRDLKYILFMALCEPCLYFLFEAKALENTTASQAGIMTAMLPILVAMAAYGILKERVGLNTWLGSLIAVVGVCWLTLESMPSQDAPNPMLGNFYEFLAMVCATGYTITLKHLSQRLSPFFLTAMQAFVGSIFYFPFLFLPATQLPVYFDPLSGTAVIYLGAVITLGAYGLYNYGLKHVPASQASAFVNLIPVFSVILGCMILGESFTRVQYVAAALVI